MILLRKKDLKFRHLLQKFELVSKSQKFVLNNFLCCKSRTKRDLQLGRVFVGKRGNTRSYKSKIIRRCILTNRGRGSLRPFLISRIVLRDLLLSGKMSGYRKAS